MNSVPHGHSHSFYPALPVCKSVSPAILRFALGSHCARKGLRRATFLRQKGSQKQRKKSPVKIPNQKENYYQSSSFQLQVFKGREETTCQEDTGQWKARLKRRVGCEGSWDQDRHRKADGNQAYVELLHVRKLSCFAVSSVILLGVICQWVCIVLETFVANINACWWNVPIRSGRVCSQSRRRCCRQVGAPPADVLLLKK